MIGVKWNLERLIGGLKVSDINKVEKAIISLDGGSYQKLMDAYLMKKYQFSNIYPLGVQTGTNKPTKGTPDSYVECDNGQYILIMYGSVEAASFSKLKSDILSCFDKSKLSLPVEKIAKIICAYTSTNLHIEQLEELKNLVEGVKIELIGIGTVAHDIVLKYHFLATRFLNIPIDSGQVFDIKEFINQYDASGMNAPLGVEFVSREKEIDDLKDAISFYDNQKMECAANIKKNQAAIDDQKRREQLEKLLIDLERDTNSAKANVVSAFNSPNAYAFFLRPLKGKVVELMEKHSNDVETVPNMTQASIDYIINKGVCVCGTQISVGSAAHQCLLAERKKMPPENIGSLARRFKGDTTRFTESSEGYFSAVDSQYKSYRMSRKQLGYRREEKQELDKNIGQNDVDVKKLNEEYNAAVRMLEQKNSELRRKYELQGSIKKEISNCDKTITQYLKNDKTNSRLRRYLAYAQALYSEFNEEYMMKESTVRSQPA